MSLEAFFKSLFITNAIRHAKIKGAPRSVRPMPPSGEVRSGSDQADDMLANERLDSAAAKSEPVIATRIIEIPVLYDDPWTRETLMRFRERIRIQRNRSRIRGTQQQFRRNRRVHQGAFKCTLVRLDGRLCLGVPWLYQMVERNADSGAEYLRRARTHPS